jgi:hypothetical protein
MTGDRHVMSTAQAAPGNPDVWLWCVFGHDSRDPLVGSDVALTQDAAREQVGDVLADEDDAVFGTVTGPGGVTERGYRTRYGGVWWMAEKSGSLALGQGIARNGSSIQWPDLG